MRFDFVGDLEPLAEGIRFMDEEPVLWARPGTEQILVRVERASVGGLSSTMPAIYVDI